MPAKKVDEQSLGVHYPTIDLWAAVEQRSAGEFTRGDRPRDHLYASDLGRCPRYLWRTWRTKKPLDKRFERGRGALGHAAEDMRARQLAPLIAAREVSFTTAHVSGRVDFILRLNGPKSPMVPLELKTTYAFSKSMNAPMPDNVVQLQWYLTQIPEAEFGILEYMNMSNWGDTQPGEVGDIIIPRDDARIASLIERAWEDVHAEREPDCVEGDDAFWCSLTEKEGHRAF